MRLGDQAAVAGAARQPVPEKSLSIRVGQNVDSVSAEQRCQAIRNRLIGIHDVDNEVLALHETLLEPECPRNA
jgi:hypothetical protein